MFQVTQISADSGHAQEYSPPPDSAGQEISSMCLIIHTGETRNYIVHIHTIFYIVQRFTKKI